MLYARSHPYIQLEKNTTTWVSSRATNTTRITTYPQLAPDGTRWNCLDKLTFAEYINLNLSLKLIFEQFCAKFGTLIPSKELEIGVRNEALFVTCFSDIVAHFMSGFGFFNFTSPPTNFVRRGTLAESVTAIPSEFRVKASNQNDCSREMSSYQNSVNFLLERNLAQNTSMHICELAS